MHGVSTYIYCMYISIVCYSDVFVLLYVNLKTCSVTTLPNCVAVFDNVFTCSVYSDTTMAVFIVLCM